MKIISKKPASYGIYKVGSKYRVVRNIKDFDNQEEASLTALQLSKGGITEEEVQSEDYKADLDLIK